MLRLAVSMAQIMFGEVDPGVDNQSLRNRVTVRAVRSETGYFVDLHVARTGLDVPRPDTVVQAPLSVTAVKLL